jgi:hypothetical protein
MANEPRCEAPTVTELVWERIEEQRARLRSLLLEQPGEMRKVTSPSDPFVWIGPPYAWPELTVEARQLQSAVLDEHKKLSALLRVLFAVAPADTTRDFEKSIEELDELIDQSHLSWIRSREEGFDRASKALDIWRELLARLHDPSAGAEPLYVPDTNALIWNPSLEEWAFPESTRFGLLLLPTVLEELDKKKIDGNAAVRQKANSLITRIKGYRSRGSLAIGVPLRRQRSTLRTTAVEPDFDHTLPWLDRTNNDDRLLAALVDVIRAHPRTPVILVTRDINLQNKAEYAHLPFVEPPDPNA